MKAQFLLKYFDSMMVIQVSVNESLEHVPFPIEHLPMYSILLINYSKSVVFEGQSVCLHFPLS